jgi:glutamine amidotransferase PdxT
VIKKLERVNGVLFPGGGRKYYRVAKIIYKWIIKENFKEVVYPLWGTCLGFETIL